MTKSSCCAADVVEEKVDMKIELNLATQTWESSKGDGNIELKLEG